MCTAIKFRRWEFSDKDLLAYGLGLYGEEVCARWNAPQPVLPIIYHGHPRLVSWGNRYGPRAPKTSFCKLESLKAGKWQWLAPEKIIILACAGQTNGVWFQVRQGMEGVLLRDGNLLIGYILTQPSTHYFKVMTGAVRMPILIGQCL